MYKGPSLRVFFLYKMTHFMNILIFLDFFPALYYTARYVKKKQK
jgi:hypothetical protein